MYYHSLLKIARAFIANGRAWGRGLLDLQTGEKSKKAKRTGGGKIRSITVTGLISEHCQISYHDVMIPTLADMER